MMKNNFENIKIENQDVVLTSQELFDKGLLRFAEQPKDNLNILPERCTLTLIEHDYPAKTPQMWNACYREFGLDAGNVMAVGEVGNLSKIISALRNDEKYLGGGVGVGFKDKIIGELDEVEPIAREIGAVNLVVKTPEGLLRGYNTDGLGYVMSLREIFAQRGESLNGKKAVILGSGGTGNAVAFMLANDGMRIVILNRTVAKAENLSHKINDYFNLEGENIARFGGEDAIEAEVSDAAAVINVSTKGAVGDFEQYSALAPAILPATKENITANQEQAQEILKNIPPSAIISDVILSGKDTPLIKSAKESGFTTLDGVPMVVYQGVEAFWLLHGNELEKKNITREQVADVMKKAASF